jgi:hypothetical protein
MKTKVFLIALCLSCFSAHIPWAAENEFAGGGLVYGQGYSFLIDSPAGWVLDTQSGATGISCRILSEGLVLVRGPGGNVRRRL